MLFVNYAIPQEPWILLKTKAGLGIRPDHRSGGPDQQKPDVHFY